MFLNFLAACDTNATSERRATCVKKLSKTYSDQNSLKTRL